MHTAAERTAASYLTSRRHAPPSVAARSRLLTIAITAIVVNQQIVVAAAAANCQTSRDVTYSCGLHRVLLMPQAKVLFCGIDKNGITTMNVVSNIVNNPAARRSWHTGKRPNMTAVSLRMGLNEVDQLLSDPAWSSVVAYRDPAERFFSGYASKCRRKDTDGWLHCDRVFHLKNVTVADVASGLSLYGRSNPHWAPMSDFCAGLVGTRWEAFTHHLRLSDLSEGLQSLLETRVPNNTLALVRSYLADIKPDARRSTGINKAHSTHAAAAMLASYPEQTRRKIVEFYASDYQLLHVHGLYPAPVG